MVTDADLEGASALIQSAIRRLDGTPNAPLLPKKISVKAQAAVAVILFQAEAKACSTHDVPSNNTTAISNGNTTVTYEPELHVVCTTRALHLRSHPGQGSLPGGKVDHTDASLVETAYRETCEEICMQTNSLKKGKIVHLCTLAPFLSKTALIVHPVVFWLPPSTAKETLASLRPSPDEVSAIWSYPLRAVLSSVEPRQVRFGTRGSPEYGERLMKLMPSDKVDVHRPPQDDFRTYSDVPWIRGHNYRLHRFRSTHQLIKGLTADVLISVAAIAYQDTPLAGPSFIVHAEDQQSWDESVSFIVQRAMSGAPREKSRWGDGESGDSYGSTERYSTQVGVDRDAKGAFSDEEKKAFASDLLKILRRRKLEQRSQEVENIVH